MSIHNHPYTLPTAEPIFSTTPVYRISLQNDTSSRRRHIRLLSDVLYLSLQRSQWDKAARAWAILARCPEVDWKNMCKVGLLLIGKGGAGGQGKHVGQDRITYLKTVMLRHQTAREAILQELVLQLIVLEKYRDALDELTLYLPSFPFHENPVLHIYAGLISIYLAQAAAPPPTASENPSSSDVEATTELPPTFEGWSYTHLRSAQRFLDRAMLLDSTNPTAKAFLDLLQTSPVGRADDKYRSRAASIADGLDSLSDHGDSKEFGTGSSRTASMTSDIWPISQVSVDDDDDNDVFEVQRLSKRVKMELIDEESTSD